MIRYIHVTAKPTSIFGFADNITWLHSYVCSLVSQWIHTYMYGCFQEARYNYFYCIV